MKKLGAYINGDTYNGGTILEQNTFVWYEIGVFTSKIGLVMEDVYEVLIWSLKGGYPNGRKPDAKFKTTNKHMIENFVIPIKEVPNKYCIEWENQQWQIKEYKALYDYFREYEYITTLKLDQLGSNNYCHWDFGGERAFSVLKDATVNRIYKKQNLTFADLYPTVPIPDIITEELKKSLEQNVIKSALNSCYGTGGFTTRPVLSPEEIGKLFDSKNKETKTMEKKMTTTDKFLKDLRGITITSTHTKMDACFNTPYNIYYPEMEITTETAETLFSILLMMKRDFCHKVVFNPKKGTTTIQKYPVEDPITVRCKDAEFDYILGYEMARAKAYFGKDDYNWFNKIMNHRKTHIEYTEKKAKKGKKS